jgi:hypothetical protein
MITILQTISNIYAVFSTNDNFLLFAASIEISSLSKNEETNEIHIKNGIVTLTAQLAVSIMAKAVDNPDMRMIPLFLYPVFKNIKMPV